MGSKLAAFRQEIFRAANVYRMQASSIRLRVDESATYEVPDLKTYELLREKFRQIKIKTGICLLTKLRGKFVLVIRIRDEVSPSVSTGNKGNKSNRRDI